MAEGIVIEGKSLEELEREITCGICQEHYTEPKALPCLHYYCKKCVLRLALRTGTGKPFSCPECSCEATLPEGGVDELKTAFFVNRLKTTVSTMERTHGRVEVKCELCSDSGGKAEAFCRQCAMFICKECIKQHKRMKPYLSHEVASLEELKQQGRAKPIIVKEAPTEKCPDHEEPLIIFCFDCESLICHHCTAKDHREHNFEFCKKAAPKTKEILLGKLESLKNQRESLAKAINNIQITKQELNENGDAVADSIQTSFKELREILDKREQELLGEAGGMVQQKMHKLSVQEKKLSLASAEVQSVVDYTEQCVRYCTDNEVMSMHAEIRRRLEREIDECSKSGRSLEPEEDADIGVEVRCAEALQQLCQTQANIIQPPIDPAKCTVTMDDSEVNKTSHSTLSLATGLSSNKISRRHCEVSCSLRSLYNNVISNCRVNQTGAGQYSIQYRPTVRGRHELTVSVDGQQVAGSPFPVFVSIHPTLLCQPVKVWTNLTGPTGITVNSAGEILVSEQSGNIVKFNTNGNRRTFVKQNRVSNLCKIEVDDKNIYCIDYDYNRILKCDQNGRNIQVQEVEHVENRGLTGLAVVGGEVMVCEKGNRGTIMVYDKKLNFVRRIEHHHNVGELRAISADSHGNLYCADISMIQVFSNDGVLLRSFRCVGKGNMNAMSPWGLCVFCHYVYVCSDNSPDIVVFTTDGVYVTSFGLCDRDGNAYTYMGDCLYITECGIPHSGACGIAHSVCVDKDGFVCVTDHVNKTVKYF